MPGAVHPLAHLGVGAFLLAIVALSARGHLAADDRYAFSMFRSHAVIRVDYWWSFPDGRREPYRPGTALRGRGTILQRESKGRPIVGGLGVIERQVPQFLDWAWTHQRPEGATRLHGYVEAAQDGSVRVLHFTVPMAVP